MKTVLWQKGTELFNFIFDSAYTNIIKYLGLTLSHKIYGNYYLFKSFFIFFIFFISLDYNLFI